MPSGFSIDYVHKKSEKKTKQKPPTISKDVIGGVWAQPGNQ
jgi:hypothetical protein